MRFAVESWAPDYGAPSDDAVQAETVADVDASVERAADDWQPLQPPPGLPPLDDLVFVDGVQRVEANVWIDVAGQSHHGICASYAAGVVRCNGRAEVHTIEVRRGLFTNVPTAQSITTRHGAFQPHTSTSGELADLTYRLHHQRTRLEVHVAREGRESAPVMIVDGPLRDGHDEPGLVGLVKTHSTGYGPPLVREVVSRLDCEQRTPIFLIGGPRPRFAWYHRLPCEVAHGWSGVVRLEMMANQPVADAAALADRLTLTLSRFASVPQKDPRAPQNLYPIGGLERELRHRLGDPALLFRSLRLAARQPAT